MSVVDEDDDDDDDDADEREEVEAESGEEGGRETCKLALEGDNRVKETVGVWGG